MSPGLRQTGGKAPPDSASIDRKLHRFWSFDLFFWGDSPLAGSSRMRSASRGQLCNHIEERFDIALCRSEIGVTGT
jgi:hypothetical protein